VVDSIGLDVADHPRLVDLGPCDRELGDAALADVDLVNTGHRATIETTCPVAIGNI
jgi:hypothetical protein